MMALVKDWLGSLSPNERRLLLAAGALAAVLGLTMFVVTPLRSAHADAKRDYEAAATLLDEVQGGLLLLEAQRPRGGAAASPAEGDQRGAVRRTALARGLAIARESPVEGGLSVRLERADPAALFAWLAELDGEHKIPVRRASLRAESDGTVQADLVLAAGGAS